MRPALRNYSQYSVALDPLAGFKGAALQRRGEGKGGKGKGGKGKGKGA